MDGFTVADTHRLIFQTTSESRAQAHENAERDASGKSSGGAANEIEAAQQEDDDFKLRVAGKTEYWFGSVSATKAEILRESEKRMVTEYPDLAASWFDIVNPAKRRARHNVQYRMARDLTKQLSELEQSKGREAAELENKFAALEGGMSAETVTVRKNGKKKVTRVQKKLAEVEKQLAEEAGPDNSGEMPPEAKKAMDAELILRKDLIRRGIVSPADLKRVFEENSKAGYFGNTELDRLIQSDPGLAKEPDLQTKYLHYASLLRSGHFFGNQQRWYRALFLTDGGRPDFSLKSRLRYVKEYPVIEGTEAKVALPGMPVKTLYAKGRSSDGARVEYEEPGDKKIRYSVFPADVENGEGYIVYKGPDGKTRETKLTDDNFRISLQQAA